MDESGGIIGALLAPQYAVMALRIKIRNRYGIKVHDNYMSNYTHHLSQCFLNWFSVIKPPEFLS